jgi:glyoxylase-like metal-dependent hydrolase (beta-lactamase superfamily II)
VRRFSEVVAGCPRSGARPPACSFGTATARLVLDAGTGARWLVTERGLLNGVEHVHVVLTHFHLDHVCGLLYLPALPTRLDLGGPGPGCTGRAVQHGKSERKPKRPNPLNNSATATTDVIGT